MPGGRPQSDGPGTKPFFLLIGETRDAIKTVLRGNETVSSFLRDSAKIMVARRRKKMSDADRELHDLLDGD